MNTAIVRVVGGVFAGSLLLTGAVALPAQAATQQVGLVNVRTGDITIQDVNVAVAAQVVATACGLVDVTNVAILVSQVDQTGTKETFCKTEAGKVTVKQD